MRRWFADLAVAVEIGVFSEDIHPEGRRLRFESAWEAERFLARLLGSHGDVAGLRRLLSEVMPGHGLALDGDPEIVRRAARMIASGALWVVERRRPVLSSWGHETEEDDIEAPPPRPPPKDDQVKTWVEIELIDWDDKPVPFEPFELTLPDQTVMQGALDGKGFARVDGIDPGTCRLRFPRRDETDWDPNPDAARVRPAAPLADRPPEPPRPVPTTEEIAAASLPKTSWIDIELLDEFDEAVPEEPYRVEAADGSIIEGKLGKNGRARVEGIVFGSCKVTFPERDGGDLDRA